MKFGVYNAILHDRSLPDAIEVIAKLGLTGIELNSAASYRRCTFPPSTTSSPPTPLETTSLDSSRAPAWRSQG